jgi:iron complex transport system ATP-binding protein
VTATALEVEQLSFAYRPGVEVLAGVSFSIEAGTLCCLLGPNGAGKTSLIRCVVGLSRPSSGTVRVGGDDVTAVPPPLLARRVAYLAQSAETAFPFSASDVVAMGRTAYVRFGGTPTAADLALAQYALRWVGIERLAERRFNELSGGERQLCSIARALAQATPVIVLDEPTSALDYGNQVRVLRILRELAQTGKAVLMTSHAPSQAFDAADTVLLLSGGRLIASGDPATVIDGPALSGLYGVSMAVVDAETPFGVRRVCVPELDRAAQDAAGKRR